jgi:hypothetical protein
MSEQEVRGEWYGVFASDLLTRRAVTLAGMHPRAADYIRQAPVIVCVSLGYRPASVLSAWKDVCNRGAKLGVVLDAFQINRGLRGLSALAMATPHDTLLGTVLRPGNPSALAQQIANRTPDLQRIYLNYLQDLVAMGTSPPVINFIAENMPVGWACEPSHLIDFLRSPFGAGITYYSQWRDVVSGMKKWEESFAKEKARHEARFNEPLTPHKYVPTEYVSKSGFTFTLLNTINQLAAEGATMRHCVGGYGGVVREGQSVIYACSKNGDRVGTVELEMGKQYLVGPKDDPETRFTFVLKQFKSRQNAAPGSDAMAAAGEFERVAFQEPAKNAAVRVPDFEPKRAPTEAERARVDFGRWFRGFRENRNG